MNARDDTPTNNRARKVEGRAKRRRFVQGTRTYLHSVTNSVARRAAAKKRKRSTR